ncbi:uncharacterized protein LOC108905445 [Anoplophora glabripennis]|uniref:uncharacterized protein LOC108905445 n=1 Tax=Anoplophora glabripennis TaxID=217634 RepID=UPI000873D79D|nr:uncharacterized protein LOC108905445 [Anoplophora glabripennis]
MKYFVLLAVFVAITTAIPVDFVEDEDGQRYVLVPVNREKRQATKLDISNTGMTLGHKSNILDSNSYKLDGSAYATKNFGTGGIGQFGGRLDYAHKPSASNVFLGADHTRHFGTDLKAGAQYNFIHKKNFDMGIVGQYERHFGGPFGTGRPQGYMGLIGTARF